MMVKKLIALFVLLTVADSSLAEDAEFDVKAHYDKAEYQIPMADGVKLHTIVYSPKDKSQKYPFLIVRTPYSVRPYGLEEYLPAKRMAPSVEFLEDGYIFVFQDGRGTYKSEGEWENLRPARTHEGGSDESTDAYDTLDWLLDNIPGHNSHAGQWGISHPGWYAAMAMIDAHPALKAVSPQATTLDAFIGDDDHHNGAYALHYLTWRYGMSIVTGPDRAALNGAPAESVDFGTDWDYEFYLNAGPLDEINEKHFNGRMTQVWQNLIDHPDYDEFWARKNYTHLLKDIEIPVLNVGGWFDATDFYGSIQTYQSIERQNPGNESTLVIGPWSHGGWWGSDGTSLGHMQFGAATSEYYKKDIIFPFFQYHLKHKGTWSPAEAIVFETGNNTWHHLAQWPPENIEKRNIYLHEDFQLSFEKPKSQAGAAFDSYVSDPAKPVPLSPDIPMYKNNRMVADQRIASTRTDVLTYKSSVLEEDLTIAGPILANLFASTSGTDSDWFVKLIDVYPADAPNAGDVRMAGYQMLLGIEVMRGKYRNSFSEPEPMTPDEITPISFHLWDKFHTFKKGHRIMIQIQSSWFPAFDRNPQTFTNIYRAKKDAYRKATQKIYRSGESPTHLVLPVLQ
jgi:putative CocE/NonD family hydrolase